MVCSTDSVETYWGRWVQLAGLSSRDLSQCSHVWMSKSFSVICASIWHTKVSWNDSQWLSWNEFRLYPYDDFRTNWRQLIEDGWRNQKNRQAEQSDHEVHRGSHCEKRATVRDSRVLFTTKLVKS
jgi:hypothetical protein